MRIGITLYKHSPLANFLSIIGTILFVMGVPFIFAGVIPGITCIAIGFGLKLWADSVAENKTVKLWLDKLNKQGLLKDLAVSNDLAYKLYKMNPCKVTLNYISRVNPTAAINIKSELQNEKKTKNN